MATRKVTDAVRDAVLNKLVKNFGEGYNTTGQLTDKLKAIPTGHDDLDCLLTLGAHGIAKGAICEMMGSEGSGKSSMALRVVGNAQKNGGQCCWLDAEAAFAHNLAIINGVDPSRLIMPNLLNTKAVVKADSMSFFNSMEVLEIIYKSVVSNIYEVVVLDSVAGLMPERVLSDDFDPNKAGMAEVARSMAQMLGKIAQAAKKTETTVILINQLRDKPGEYFQDRFHTPGGKALKFFAHQRLGIEKINGKGGAVLGTDENGEEVLLGHYARCTIVKNKMAPPVPPNVTIEVPIYYVKYDPDNAKKCYDLARALKVITIRNGVLTWKDNDAIILKEEGESVILTKIREGESESQLAAQCIEVAKGEKNQGLKQPVRISKSIIDIAGNVKPPKVLENVEEMGKKSKKTVKKKTKKTTKDTPVDMGLEDL